MEEGRRASKGNVSERDLTQRMELFERNQEKIAADVVEIKRALLGGYDGSGGLSGKVERNREEIERLDRRISKNEAAIEQNTLWRQSLTAQWRLLMLLSGGNLATLIALLVTLIKLANQ